METTYKKKILILVFNSLRLDVRVKRQIKALRPTYEITAACYEPFEEAGVEFIIIKPKSISFVKKIIVVIPLALRLYKTVYKILFGDNSLTAILRKRNFDLVISNDIETLPLAFSLNIPNVILDAHEYAPRHFEDRILWKLFYQGFNQFLCVTHLAKLSGMMTVGYGLAKEYERNFGIKPIVITNADHFINLNPKLPDENRIKLVHHGIANPSRKIEEMIEMMNHLDDRFILYLILLSPGYTTGKTKNYLETLKAKNSNNPKVKFLPPVKSDEISTEINQYDIGVFLLPPSNFNYENALPNKFFNFIQARLGIAVGPTPEMASIVKEYKLGVVSDDFTPINLANKLNALTREDIIQFKLNASTAATDFNAQKNAILINQLVENVLH